MKRGLSCALAGLLGLATLGSGPALSAPLSPPPVKAIEAGVPQPMQIQDRPDQPCAAADAIARQQLAAVEARLARLRSLKTELERMVAQCAHGTVADCRVIETLADHGLCHGDHAAGKPLPAKAEHGF